MLVILAELNGSPELEVREAIKLKKSCEKLGIPHPVNINTVEDLIDLLGEDRDQSFLLFSNFPPNSSYAGSGESMNLVDEGDTISRSWPADSYSISLSLFKTLNTRYSFDAIHIITGAPHLILTDEKIKAIFPDLPITIKRKKVWIESGESYQHLYRLFVEEKIKEALQS